MGMTEIRFYHAQHSSLLQFLPGLLAKALAGGHRIVVRLPDDTAIEALNDHLWTYSADSFLPHGTKKEGHAAAQPIWLTNTIENPNQANMLLIVPGSAQDVAADIGDYALCCDVIEGQQEEEVAAARARWKSYKDVGYDVTYWQQTSKGWEKKA